MFATKEGPNGEELHRRGCGTVGLSTLNKWVQMHQQDDLTIAIETPLFQVIVAMAV
jgi:hypothetical protein